MEKQSGSELKKCLTIEQAYREGLISTSQAATLLNDYVLKLEDPELDEAAKLQLSRLAAGSGLIDKTQDPVSPEHYKRGKIEPWDYIHSQNLGFFEGNIVKYVTRWKDKGGVEDLKKCIAYAEKLIELNS